MNSALLIGIASVILPVVAFEVRRKWREARRVRRAREQWVDLWSSAEWDGTIPAGKSVWMGFDHGSDAYAGNDSCAPGNTGEVSTPGSDCGGGDA